MTTGKRESRSMAAVNLGLGSNIILAVLKTLVGIAGHSPALLSDGINSVSDVVYYIVVSIFVRLAHKPADREHPYGHSQLESIAALVVGAFVMTTAVAIFWDAVNKVFDLVTGQSAYQGASPWALYVALFTIGGKILLSIITRRIGDQTNNPAVLALAQDHRNDIFAATAAGIGIFLGRIGLPWVDPLAGALVAVIILLTGIEIVRNSSRDLMDAVPGKDLHDRIVNLLSSIPQVIEVEETQAHRFGPYLVIYITICIDGKLSVAEGDRIAMEVEDLLYREINLLKRVHIHYHPPACNGPATA
jgi:cation diffusion facilitator family transporter